MRLFIAIELPPHISSALSGIQAGVPGARWTPEANMHLTMRFLGETDGGQAEDLAYELQRVDRPSFEIELDGAGQFSRGPGVKALWMGLRPEAPLIELHGDIERAVRKSGFAAEGRVFKPHITLARFSYPPEIDRAREFLERYGRFKSPPFRVSGFTLFSSELRPKHAVYRSELDFPFSDAGIGETPFFDDWDDDMPNKPVRMK